MATTLKKQEEEIEKLKKDLEKLRNKYPPEKTQKIDIGNMLFKIGEKYFDIGRFDRSLSYYNQSLEIRREILSSKDPEIAATLYIMGVAYYKRGNSKKALEFYFHCLRKHKQTLPPDHVDIAKTLHSIGKAYFYQGENDTALDYFNQALEMYKKTLPSNHADIGRVINSIGVVYDKKGQYKEALDYYKRALEIYKQTLPLNHPHIAKQLNNIGLAYFESGQLNEALDFCNQAMKICRQTLPSNHPGFTRLVSIIGREYLDERSQSKILDMLEKKKSNPDYSASKDDFHKEDELNEDFKNESAVKKPTLHSNITKTIEKIHKIQEKLSKETLTDSRLEIIDDDFLGKSFVNRYKVIKYLGGGSYGQVYLVNDMKDSNKEKAMKIMKKDETSKNELDRMKSVNHENIVKYIDDFEMIKGHNTYICIITEYCSNGNLAKKIASKKRNPTENNFTESEIFEWIFQAVKGLRYLHSNGIIHRDIKPENILLNENNVVKLCDLGIAKLTEETIHASTFAGTRPYMSPELFECSFSKNEQKYSFNTDIWSLGCVLYELMFLKKAFPKGPGTNPIVSDLDKSTQHFASNLRKMLEKNPEKRISSNSLYNRLLDSELKI